MTEPLAPASSRPGTSSIRTAPIVLIALGVVLVTALGFLMEPGVPRNLLIIGAIALGLSGFGRAGPFLLVAFAAGIAVWAQKGKIEGNFIAVYTIVGTLFCCVAALLWVLVVSGMRWRNRLITAASGVFLLVGLGVALRSLTRREGSFTGAGVPYLVWAWSPRHVAPPLAPIAADPAAAQHSAETADDFPQFLGPGRDNQVRNVTLGRDWKTHPPQLVWKHQVGLGFSGFSVVGSYAITMEQRGEEESTVCYDLQTGQPRWVHANPVYLHENEGGDGPRATPTIADGKVYTLGGLGDLDCLSAATGEAAWSQKTLRNPSFHLRYGQASSPLIVDDKLIVTGGDSSRDPSLPDLLAFDKKTGVPLWACVSGPASYASPSVAVLAGVRQVLQLHQNFLAGHDLADGHVLWQFPWHKGIWPKNSQIVPVGNDRVYCSAGYGAGSIVLQISRTGSALEAKQVWHSRTMLTHFSNIVLRDGYVIGLDDGTLTAQDLASGETIWTGSHYGHGQIMQVGDLLLAQTETGDVALVDDSRSGPTELGRFSPLTVSRIAWNPPALAGHLLLVRSDKEAACYRLP